ncbi:hypothetical protein ACI78V_18035 [Geodermatophilus sp. SYSU D00742]
MTASVPVRRSRSALRAGTGAAGWLPGRVAAVLALASAGVHAAAVDAASLTSLAMTGMALACLPCAWHLWRAPAPRVWGTTVLLDLGMLAVHAPVAAGSGGHVHGGTGPAQVGVALVTASLLLGLAVLGALAVRTAAGRLPLPADGEETPRP